MAPLIRISRDAPALYITSVAKDRLPVFQTDKVKDLACAALNEARNSGKFALLAYVIMPDHFHFVTSGQSPAHTLRFANGVVSHRVIEYLKEGGFRSSLEKLRHEEKPRRYTHSLLEHHSNVFLVTTEAVLAEKVNYIHLNPVRAKLVTRAAAYRWSSVRQWESGPGFDEPLLVDKDRVAWRSRA